MAAARRKTSQMWELRELPDFARVTRWLEQRRDRHKTEALSTYFRRMTEVMRENVDVYQQRAQRLDRLCGGLLSAPGSVHRPGVEAPPGASLLSNLRLFADQLRMFFDPLLTAGDSDVYNYWLSIISNTRDYLIVLHRLINEFGNFEILLPTLPGTGEMVAQAELQDCLDEMYKINTANLRMLDLIRQTNKAWSATPPWPNHGFFDPNVSFDHLVQDMINDYLTEADPARIRSRKQAAKNAGKRYQAYRFWRAAETLRLMSRITYLDGPQRRPVPQRTFLQTDLTSTEHFVADARRIEWTIKEIFNNALSAASQLFVSPTGEWAARPLPRHDTNNPNPAVRVDVKETYHRQWFRKRKHLVLTIADEGVGIAAEHLPHVTKWAYSPRREYFRQLARQSRATYNKAHREIQIGGKGIGLSYAEAVIREHGGSMSIESTVGEGTTVTIDLPVPTPLPV